MLPETDKSLTSEIQNLKNSETQKIEIQELET